MGKRKMAARMIAEVKQGSFVMISDKIFGKPGAGCSRYAGERMSGEWMPVFEPNDEYRPDKFQLRCSGKHPQITHQRMFVCHISR